MADESEDSELYSLLRFIINLGGLAVSAAIVALIVATIIVEMD